MVSLKYRISVVVSLLVLNEDTFRLIKVVSERLISIKSQKSQRKRTKLQSPGQQPQQILFLFEPNGLLNEILGMQKDICIFSSHENHMYSVVCGTFGLSACESVLSHSLWVKRLHSPPAGLCSVFPCQELNLGGVWQRGRPVFPEPVPLLLHYI